VPRTSNLLRGFGWLWKDFLSRRRRWQGVGLVGVTFLGGLAELFTLGAIFPFLGMIAKKAGAYSDSGLGAFLARFGLDLGHLSITAAAALFCGVVLITAGLRILVVAVSQKFVFRLGYDLGTALYERVLYQPYSFHVATNSSTVLSAVTQTQKLLRGMFLPLVQGFSAIVVSLFIIAGLLLLNPLVASVAILGFSAIYVMVTLLTRPTLSRNAAIIAEMSKKRIQVLQEGLGGIRNVLIDNTQPAYVKTFAKREKKLRDAQAANTFIAATPRFLVEALGMILIVAIALLLASQEGGLVESLPVLAVLALGAQRLLPLLQQAYNAWASVVGNRAALLEVIELLQQPIPKRFAQPNDTAPLPFEQSLVLKDVSFRYDPEGLYAVRDVDLEIPRGARVGFIGRSGSGKSTLVDLIMGLLPPTAGTILVDGVPLCERNVLAWQKQVAHVSQHIFLTDGTIVENVAMGVHRKDIDVDRVRQACAKAQLEEFIATLPQGYETIIGERGVRLSGGQRQRIGIARALYKKSSLLVLDEATSALDDMTEAEIIAAVQRLGPGHTVLMIAHRVTTLEECDMVVSMEGGRVVAQGSYDAIVGRRKSRAGARRLHLG
jgi:ATP-binding cassette subfamily B protein